MGIPMGLKLKSAKGGWLFYAHLFAEGCCERRMMGDNYESFDRKMRVQYQVTSSTDRSASVRSRSASQRDRPIPEISKQ
jgi:hypothetical protein